jgi:biopolymer transport protein ExbB/biopolymer transport protein TolQ
MELNWLALAEKMGWGARAIVLVLAIMSVAEVALAVSKWRRLRMMARATLAFAPEFAAALDEGRVDRALAASTKYPRSHAAKVLGAALQRVVPLLGDPQRRDRAMAIAERTIDREQILLATELRSGLGGIATVGATAPFVGLLGTVMGITNSFTGMAEAGGGGIEAVAGGIGETLVTTALGLLVAIPAVWLYNYFTTRLERLFSEVAYMGQELVDWIEAADGGSEPATAAVTGPAPAKATHARSSEVAVASFDASEGAPAVA